MSEHHSDLTPKQIIEHFLQLFSSGHTDAAMDCLAAEARWWVAGSLEGLSGTYSREQMRALLCSVRDLYQEGALHIRPLGWTISDDRVAVEAESQATFMDGRVYRNAYHFLFRLQDGLISEIREYSDTHHMYESFIRPPGSA